MGDFKLVSSLFSFWLEVDFCSSEEKRSLKDRIVATIV